MKHTREDMISNIATEVATFVEDNNITDATYTFKATVVDGWVKVELEH